MKILMLHPHDAYCHPWMIRPLKFAEQLINRGHEVTLCHIPDQHRRDTIGIIHKDIPKGLNLVELEWPRRKVWANARRVAAMAKDVDIIHFQKCTSNIVIPALWAASLWDKPLHYDWDDWETAIAEEMGVRGAELLDVEWYEKRLPLVSDTISGASQELRDKCLRMGIAPEWIFPAPVGADIQFFHPDKSGVQLKKQLGIDGPVVMYSGQLEGAHYVGLLLEAIPAIQKQFPETNFFILGGGKSLDDLKRTAQEKEIKNIHFTGYIGHELIPEYLGMADVAVACFEDTPVTRCKSPLKIAEYLAAGKAIVASRVGEVIPMMGECGLLSKPGDAEDLAEKIIQFLKDPGLRHESSLKARAKAETEYNWETTVDHLESAYKKALLNQRVSRYIKAYYYWQFSLVSLLVYATCYFRKDV